MNEPREHGKKPGETVEELRLFVANTPAAVAMVDRDMKYVAVSDRWLSEHAAKDRNILGRSAYEVFPDIPERWREIHRRCLEGAVEKCDADPWVRSDGTTEWIRWEIRPWRRSADVIGGLMIFSEVVTDRKRAEEALRESAERLQLSVAAANIGLWDWDLRSNTVRFSREWKNQLGYRDDEISDRFDEWQGRVHPDDLEGTLGRINAYLADPRGRLHNEFRMRHKDGSYRWILAHGSVLRDEDGRAARMLGSHIDISEPKQAEEELRINAHLLSESQRIARVGTFVWEIKTGHILWTDESYRLYGVNRESFAVSAESGISCIHADDQPIAQEWVCASMAGEEPYPLTYRTVWPDGSIHWLVTHGQLYRGADGTPIQMVGTIQDITERKHAEEKLQHTVTKLQRAVQSTITVISAIGELRDPYTHGHEHRVGELATAIAAKMGLSADQIDGIRVAGYLHDVGKVAVPVEILAKPARLTKAEFELVKQHAQQSYDILKTVEFPWPVAEAAWQHHERMDGSGYPRGLKGTEIILEARILAVADTVEAMASHRPYRPGLGIDKALDELQRGSGTIYDTQVAVACLDLFRKDGYQLPK